MCTQPHVITPTHTSKHQSERVAGICQSFHFKAPGKKHGAPADSGCQRSLEWEAIQRLVYVSVLDESVLNLSSATQSEARAPSLVLISHLARCSPRPSARCRWESAGGSQAGEHSWGSCLQMQLISQGKREKGRETPAFLLEGPPEQPAVVAKGALSAHPPAADPSQERTRDESEALCRWEDSLCSTSVRNAFL